MPELNDSCDFQDGFIYTDEPLLGRADKNGDQDFSDTGETFYYTTNNLYNVTALLDTSGNIIERYEYRPYGKATVYVDDGGDSDWFDGDETPGALTGNYYTFTGRSLDPESGLMYFRNRYYSAIPVTVAELMIDFRSPPAPRSSVDVNEIAIGFPPDQFRLAFDSIRPA